MAHDLQTVLALVWNYRIVNAVTVIRPTVHTDTRSVYASFIFLV